MDDDKPEPGMVDFSVGWSDDWTEWTVQVECELGLSAEEFGVALIEFGKDVASGKTKLIKKKPENEENEALS